MKTVKSFAKVNLTLDVLGLHRSGYHLMQTILHEVKSLFDELTFEVLEGSEIIIECDDEHVPTDDKNTIHQAARLLQKKYNIEKGVKVTLQKNIPIRSGLGGGSSNAATTLKALNELWGLNISTWELRNLSAEIGMDVPFFITGGAALGMHLGEQLMHLPILPHHNIEVIKTGIEVSTKEAFESLDLSKCGKQNSETGILWKVLKGIKKGDVESLIHNDFERVFFEENPSLKEQYPEAHLSGSGGCLFQLKTRAVLPSLV
jgi:4-diphosphocytidyl-2-C-methyl-D-erythritol kinase